MGPQGATRHSACPIVRHSESSPLRLSVLDCRAIGSASGQTACPGRPTLRQSRSHHSHVGPLGPGARLRPSYQSGCMFLFYLFVVRLPCRSIFCQFWLCEEAQCVYLRTHFGSLESFFNSLVVGLPYSFIFWHFCLLSSFWLCKEAQCIYLCLPSGHFSKIYVEGRNVLQYFGLMQSQEILFGFQN